MSAGSPQSISTQPGVLLPQRFAAWASATPERIALRCVDEGAPSELTYAELAARSEALAKRLLPLLPAATDVTPLVGIRLPAGAEQIIAMLAVWKAGAAYLPLASSAEREAQIIAAAKPVVVIDAVFISQSAEALADELPAYSAERLAYVMFTSGSTGAPKGVAVTHANIADLLAPLVAELGIDSEDVWSQLHSLGFGYSVWEIWGALATGAALFIAPEPRRKDPRRVSALLAGAEVSVLSLTPSGLAQWLALDDLQLPASLRLVVLSGEAIVPAHLDAWFVRFGKRVRMLSTYAITETAGRVCLAEYLAGEPIATALVGKPVNGMTLLLVNAAGEPVAEGESGELLIAGAGLAAGYWRDAALTAEKFVWRAGVRWYRSGDRMRCNEAGYYEFVGRVDQQLKLRGYRIEPAEIEAVIRRHPTVHDVAVDLVQREGAEPVLAAWYQLHESGNRDNGDSRDSRPEFWPSLGEYQIYDELLYDFMTADQVRVDAYARAFAAQAKDKVVLDIGTGQDALLARLALAAGARKVYAVEVIPEVAERAAKLVRELKQDHRITVICGDMQWVQIPELIDICTQGIVGNIGSSDGIVPIWNSAVHLLAPDYKAVPSRCITQIAAVELPAELQQPAFSALAADYTETIFANAGRRFDIRLCVRNFPEAAKLSSSAVFEDLNFQAALQADDSGTLSLSFSRDGLFSGVLLWTEVETMPGDVVDFLDHQQAWLPVYLPLLDAPAAVCAGDVANIQWVRETGSDGVFPDYRLQLTLNGEVFPEYVTRHHEEALGRNAFYQDLHRSLETPREEGRAGLQAWVAAQLPDYMRPSVWKPLPAMPLNTNGKLDRAALPIPHSGSRGYKPPRTPLQTDLAGLWARLLNVERVGLGEDFFDIGGDSILAVRLTTEIQRLLDDTVFLAAVFGAPEIAALAAYLETNHAVAVAKRYQANVVAEGHLIPAAERIALQPLPLSFAQQSLWFLDRLYPGSTAANEQFVIRLGGALDIGRLQSAWHELQQRHDIVLTRFACVNDLPVQVVDAALIRPIEWVDNIGLPELAATEINSVFNLQQGPLWRARFCADGDSYCLLVTVHHILADGLSVELIRDELAALYAGNAPGLPELQFSDFARWQREQSTDTAALSYWQEQLRDAEYVLNLPQSASQSLSAFSMRHELALPAVIVNRLRALTKAQSTSLFVLLLTALRTVLARYSGQTDFLLGSPVTLRQSAQLESIIGCMVNNVAFRNPLREEQTFSEALLAERSAMLAALEHATLPFEAVVEALDPPREFGRHPLFQALLMYEDRSAAAVCADGVEFSIAVVHPPRPSYWDLEVTLVDAGAGHDLRVIMNVQSGQHEADLAQRLTESFGRVLTALADDLEVPLAALPVAIAGEQAALQSAPARDYAPCCLHELFEAQVLQTPESVALIADGEALSYAALNERANRCAHGLLAAGLQPGQRVGLYMARSAGRVVALLAAFKAGLTLVPLDRSWPHERLIYMGSRAGLAALLVAEPGHAAELDADLPAYTEAGFAKLSAVTNPSLVVNPEAAAWVLFTSGSTGKPKGVAYSHTAAAYRVRWMWEQYAFSKAERFVHRSSCNFIDAYWELFGPLAHGACVVLPPAAADRDPALLLQTLIEQSVSHLVAVPSLLQTVLTIAENSDKQEQLHLQSIICSGELLQSELRAQLRLVLPQTRVFNTYGTTETWDISVQVCEPGALSEAGVVGKPLPGVTAWVLDAGLQPVPVSVWGQLYVGGIGLGLSYAGEHPGHQAQALTTPLPDGRGLYATGDRVRFTPAGELELGGRCDRQINVRGFRVEPAEIEQHLLQHPAVACAAVVQRVQPQSGMNLVVAYLTPVNDTEQPEPMVLREFVRGWLPDVVVPVEYVWLPSLPLTASGKTDYLQLPEPDWNGTANVRRYAAPVTDTEKQLALLWQEVLSVEQVGRDDDFFALRGHSLLAAQLMSRVCDVFATDLPLQCLFEHPSLRGFAASIDTIRWALNDAVGSAAQDATDREVLRF